jgi:hypothetical protein
LSKTIVEKIDFHQGDFFTILPKNANVERLYELSYGGIISPIPYGDKTYRIEGVSEEFHPQQVIAMNDKCCQFISDYTKKKHCNFVIIENYMLEPDSPHVDIKNVRMAPYKNDVYYILTKENSLKEINKTIRRSSQVWHSLFVLTQIENGVFTNLNNKTLSDICDNAKFVITGAYDGEGYIFWEKMKRDFKPKTEFH